MNSNKNNLVFLSVDCLFSHPDNPRKELGDLTELANSIKENGIMQNLTVVPFVSKTNPKFNGTGYYTVIIGHRRLAAAKLAGLAEVPCVIADMTPQEQLSTMLLENMQRSDLTVYEQALGFQMMFDFGESVDSISRKTGFSETTVRRRLKMAELDHDTLKDVSARQLSLDDFDKLSKIEDINERNSVLKEIGTANFNYRVQSAIKKQNIDAKLPLIKNALRKLHGNKIERSETYGGKYDCFSSVDIVEWDPETPIINEKKMPDKLFYYIDDYAGAVRFYKLAPRAKSKKRPQKEIDREKYITETREALASLTADMYQLRCDFISGLNVTTKNIETILSGAVTASAMYACSYMGIKSELIYKELRTEAEPYGTRSEKTARAAAVCSSSSYPVIIHTIFGDKADNGYVGGYYSDFPKHTENYKLDILYDWLVKLGYEMNDVEKALMDGTHELFIDKDEEQCTDEALEALADALMEE